MKNSSIRSKIFLAELSLLIVLPLAVYIMFSVTITGFMRSFAERDLTRLLEAAEPLTREAFSVPWLEREGVHNRSGAYSNAISPLLSADAWLIIFDENQQALYPSGFVFPEGSLALTPDDAQRFLTESLQNEAFQDGTAENGQRYLYCVRKLDDGDGPIRYMLAYSPLYNTYTLFERVGKLVLLITALIAAISLPIAWLTARRISAPLMRLSACLDQIGQGEFPRIPEEQGAREVVQLSKSVIHMSERLSRYAAAQKTFIENASHDLRTPLTCIGGYAEGLEYDVFEDPKEIGAKIAGECARLSDLIDDLLALSRMDNDDQAIALVPVGLGAFLQGQVSRLEGAAAARGLRFILNLPQPEPYIYADEQLFIRVFENLFSNAMRYARSCIWVQADIAGGDAVILMEDDGPGLAPQSIPRLFDRFYKSRDGQSGLGLAIVKTSLEYMGGSVRAYNGRHGAAFEVHIGLCPPGHPV